MESAVTVRELDCRINGPFQVEELSETLVFLQLAHQGSSIGLFESGGRARLDSVDERVYFGEALGRDDAEVARAQKYLRPPVHQCDVFSQRQLLETCRFEVRIGQLDCLLEFGGDDKFLCPRLELFN